MPQVFAVKVLPMMARPVSPSKSMATVACAGVRRHPINIKGGGWRQAANVCLRRGRSRRIAMEKNDGGRERGRREWGS